MEQNYDFTCMLFDKCHNNAVNLQFASSASIYGKNKEFKEDSPVDPRTPYAWSKYFAEKYMMKNNYHIRLQIFRYFNVYGPHEEDKGNQASPYHQFEKQARENKTIKLFKNSDKYRRDFINVKDVITVHKKFLNYRNSGIWNLGTGTSKSFQEVAETISKQYKAKIEYTPFPKHLENSYQEFTQADISKLIKTLKQ